MNPRKLFISLLIAVAMALLAASAARAEEATDTVAFSDLSKPGTLKIRVARGDVTIHGADVKEISVKSESKRESKVRKDGLRVVTASSTFTLTEKDNVASLESGMKSWSGGNSDFTVTVPMNTSIVVSNSWGGDIKIGDVSGDIDVRSMNGEVKLSNVRGGVSVETMNGEIHASIAEFHAGKALTFSSMNGEVSLKVPEDGKANVRFRTHNGTILTDFDEKALVTVTESSNRPSSKIVVKKGEEEEDEPNTDWHERVRDASRQVAEATREAAEAAREAARAIHEGMAEGGSYIAPIPPIPPIPPISGGKIVSGTLNGGGPDIQIATMNGDITLRKAPTTSSSSSSSSSTGK